MKRYIAGSCDIACQANYKTSYISHNCTCKRHKKIQCVDRVYKPNSRISVTELGKERIKLIPRKRVKKVYLPETTLFKDYNSFKNLSTKCVGGGPSPDTVCKSVATSQLTLVLDRENIDICIGNSSADLGEKNMGKQKSTHSKIGKEDIEKQDTNINITQENPKRGTEKIRVIEFSKPLKNHNEGSSSKSSIEQIYNLESLNTEKQNLSTRIRGSPENLRELPPDRIQTISRPISIEQLSEKSFESSRQGLNWTKELIIDSSEQQESSFTSSPYLKDVSVESDPPSLEARSYSDTKLYRPTESLPDQNNVRVLKDTIANKVAILENDCDKIVNEDINNMFKLWGKKFNLESISTRKNDISGKIISIPGDIDSNIIDNLDDLEPAPVEEKKKHNRLFSLFKKKNKQKQKNPFKGKSVTAGRCEITDGVVVNVNNESTLEPTAVNINNVTKPTSNILRKSWLTKFISKPVELQESIQIRWGNKSYGSNSTTISELMDCAHKDNSIIFRSKSDISRDISDKESDTSDNIPRRKVTFKQDIKAWMIPYTICDPPVIRNEIPKRNVIPLYTDKSDKSKAKDTIDIFWHADKTVKKIKESSEYITINIPEGYFSEDSEYQKQSTDEEVYNIVEYETHNSKDDVKEKEFKIDRQLDTGDYVDSKMKVKINVRGSETKLRNKTQYRDVKIPGSPVGATNNTCDVIGVGIITQNPLMNIHNGLTDDESKQILKRHKKCKLAENYLKDYCRNILPLDLNLVTSYANESQIYSSSEHNSNTSEYKVISKSNSNVCQNYRKSIISSCKMPDGRDEDKLSNFFRKLKLPGYYCPPEQCVRACPKNSLEVYKKRLRNAISNKCNWGVNEEYKGKCTESKPTSTTSTNNTTLNDCPGSSQYDLRQSGESINEILHHQESNKFFSSLRDINICSEPINILIPASVEEECQVDIICRKRRKEPEESSIKSPESNEDLSKKEAYTQKPSCCTSDQTNTADKQQKICVCQRIPVSISRKCFDRVKDDNHNISTSYLFVSCKPDTPLKSHHSLYKQSITELVEKQISAKNSQKCNTQNKSDQYLCLTSETLPYRNRQTSVCTSCSLNSNIQSNVIKCYNIGSTAEQLATQQISIATSCARESDILKESDQIINSNEYQDGKSDTLNESGQDNGIRSNKERKCMCLSKKKKKIKNTSSSHEAYLIPENKKFRCTCKSHKIKRSNKCFEKNLETLSTENEMSQTKCVSNVTENNNCLQNITRQLNNDNFGEFAESKNGYDVITLNSKENILIKLKETPSTEEYGKNINIKVQDEDGRTLYERKDYCQNKEIANNNKEYLVKNMYGGGSTIEREDTIVNHQKNLDDKEEHNNINVVEINLTLKFKQPEKILELHQSRFECPFNENKRDFSGVTYEGENKCELCDDKDDLNVNISIKDSKASQNYNICAMPKCDKLVSTSRYEEVLHHQIYSFHEISVNVINSLDNLVQNKQSKAEDTKEIILTSSLNKKSITIDDKTLSYNNSKTTKESISIFSDNHSYKEVKNVVSKSQEGTKLSKRKSALNDSIEAIVSRKLVSLLKKLCGNDKKELLKIIFEIMGNAHQKSKKTKFKRLQHLLDAILTSDSSDFEEAGVYKSLPSINYNKTNCCHRCTCDSTFTLNISSKTANKSKDLIPSIRDSNDTQCDRSGMPKKLKIIHNNHNFCSCCSKGAMEKSLSCTLGNQSKFIEVETQDSRNTKLVPHVVSNMSTTIGTPPIRETSRPTKPKKQEIKKINKEKVIYFASDKVLFFLSDSTDTTEEIQETEHINKPEDILQLKETKKAVLEIYSQKRISNTRGQITAKLPKFISKQLRPCNVIRLD